MRRPLVPLGVALAVVVASLLPGAGAPTAGGLPWDKPAHALGGAALALASAWALRRRDGRALLACALLAVLVGAGIELAQAFVPGRHPSLLDLTADAVGAALGALAARRFTRASRGP